MRFPDDYHSDSESSASSLSPHTVDRYLEEPHEPEDYANKGIRDDGFQVYWTARHLKRMRRERRKKTRANDSHYLMCDNPFRRPLTPKEDK